MSGAWKQQTPPPSQTPNHKASRSDSQLCSKSSVYGTGSGDAVPSSGWSDMVWAGVAFALPEKEGESGADPWLLVWDAAACSRDPQPWGERG